MSATNSALAITTPTAMTMPPTPRDSCCTCGAPNFGFDRYCLDCTVDILLDDDLLATDEDDLRASYIFSIESRIYINDDQRFCLQYMPMSDLESIWSAVADSTYR